MWFQEASKKLQRKIIREWRKHEISLCKTWKDEESERYMKYLATEQNIIDDIDICDNNPAIKPIVNY